MDQTGCLIGCHIAFGTSGNAFTRIPASFTSCCTVPVIGAIAGYSGSLGGDGRKKAIWISALAFFIGTVVSLSLVGALTGLVSKAVIAGIGNYWKIAAGILTIFFGLSTLNWLPFKMPSVKFTTKEFGTGIFQHCCSDWPSADCPRRAMPAAIPFSRSLSELPS